MKISPTKHTKNNILIISSAIVVVILVLAAFLYIYRFDGNLFGWTAKQNTDTTSKSPIETTDEQKKAGNETTENGVDQPPAPVSQPGSDKKTVEVSITAANQNSGTLQVRALISTVTASGNCTLSLTKSGQVVTKSADVQALASTSTCKGFDIPVSELSTGSWQLNLTYESDSLKGTTSKTVVIE